MGDVGRKIRSSELPSAILRVQGQPVIIDFVPKKNKKEIEIKKHSGILNSSNPQSAWCVCVCVHLHNAFELCSLVFTFDYMQITLE